MAKVRFLFLLVLLIALVAPIFAAEEETPIDEIEQQEQEQEEEQQQQEEEGEEEYKSEKKADEDGYVHLVIRRKFVNKTFFATIPSLVQVQIYNLGTATAKKVKVVDTYPDTFTDFIEEYSFDKIAPREYWMTPMFPGKITIPRIKYTYGGSREWYYDDDEEKDDRVHGYGDVEVDAVVETTNEYHIRTAPHGMDWVIVGVSSLLVCALPFILYRKN